MQIIAAIKELEKKFSNEVPALVWATGSISYDYHFTRRGLFDALVTGSWHKNGTLFSADTTNLVVENEDLMGIEIGMPGAEFRSRQKALGPIWQGLVEKGRVNVEEIAGVLQRSEDASWLNPTIHANTYSAFGVPPEYRMGLKL